MMPNLTERYIHAATRTVPEKGRADLRAELEGSIGDAIDARVATGETHDRAERAVLNDLGDPDRLAADYTDQPTYLIGPRYYFGWLRLVKLLLVIVLPFAALGIALGQVLSGSTVGEAIGGVIGILFSVALNLIFWPTLVFVVLERTAPRGALADASPFGAWSVDNLPEIRDPGLGLGDFIGSLIMLFVTAIAVIWDRVHGLVNLDGSWISFLHPGMWPWWISVLFVLLAGTAVVEFLVFRRARWTWSLAIANAALTLTFTIGAIWLLLAGHLVNPEVIIAASWMTPDLTVILAWILVAIFAAAGVWNTASSLRKAANTGA